MCMACDHPLDETKVKSNFKWLLQIMYTTLTKEVKLSSVKFLTIELNNYA